MTAMLVARAGLRCAIERDAADRNNGHGSNGPGCGELHEVQSYGVITRAPEYRPDGQYVIGSARAASTCSRVCGEADDRRCAQEDPCSRRRQIVLPDVHAGCTRHARNVGPVVHDNCGAVRDGRRHHRITPFQERAARHALGAHLKEACAAVQARAHRVRHRPAARGRDVRIHDGRERRQDHPAAFSWSAGMPVARHGP